MFNDSDKSVWIEVRESQHKYHESHYCDWMFEVVNCSGPSKSASIGPQLLGVLARAQDEERNLQLLQYLSTLLDSEIKKSCDTLLDIRDRALLRKALESLDRRLRAREGESSRDGAQFRFSTREEEEDDLQNMTGRNGDDTHPLSGQPTTLAAQAIRLLESGFDIDDPTLLTLLRKLLDSTIDTNVASQRISVPKSRVLYVATDTLGLLAPGQIFVQLSEVNESISLSDLKTTDAHGFAGKYCRREDQTQAKWHLERASPHYPLSLCPANGHTKSPSGRRTTISRHLLRCHRMLHRRPQSIAVYAQRR